METIEHTLVFDRAAAEVYAAVAEPRGIAGWWSTRSSVDARVGGECVLHFDKGGTEFTMRFRIESLESPSHVEWICTHNTNASWVGTRLVFAISTEGGGTTLRFAHEGFAEPGPGVEATRQGWGHFMASLRSFVETGVGRPWG